MSSGTSYGGGLGGLLSSLSGADNVASDHAGSSGDKDLFSSALGMLSNRSESQLKDEDLDEEDMVSSHDSYYGSGAGTGGSASSGGIGKAAAMQAVKMFNSGEASGGGSSGGEGGKGKLIGLAMGQAAKLFDQQSSAGNVSSGESKQSAIQQAGEAALKMYLKSEMGMGGGGGSSSGGSGLMGMASKFLSK